VAIAAYLVWKVPMYVAALFRPQRRWVRTARELQPAPVGLKAQSINH
jgi:hypothetical protein